MEAYLGGICNCVSALSQSMPGGAIFASKKLHIFRWWTAQFQAVEPLERHVRDCNPLQGRHKDVTRTLPDLP